ncbi:MAG: hypothetical protein KJ638_02695, partial [Chloroflexi bacterium]|nr:hypothetical protein [Chloroflexota bacterium]
HRDTATFLKEVDADHQAMSTEQRQRLSAQADELHRDTATFLKEVDAAHQAMATEQGHHLAAERECLASQVLTERRKLQADQSEARRAWSSFALIMQQRRGGKVAVPPVVEEAPLPPPVEAVAPPPVVESPPEEVASDDLTIIRGIGPSMAKRLNKAGICAYAQLAGSTPEELRQHLAEAGRLAKVEEWIAQAQELAG